MRSTHQQPGTGKQGSLFMLTPFSFLRRDDGTTAIEFGMVAISFFMFVFGLIAVSTYIFIMTSIEKGMDQASRLIRTGQAQSQESPMTVGEFKKTICRKANSKADSDTSDSAWVKCNNLQIFVQTYASWADVVPTSCLNNNQVVVNTASDTDPIAAYSGEANAIVLITACYRWKLAGKIPYINLGQMSDGSMMMQSATAFRTEPYAVSQ